MIEHTFLHLPHIGPRTEIDLWRRGILTWDDLELHLKDWPKNTGQRRGITRQLHESIEHRGQAAYFYNRLPSAERWRLYQDFQNRCGFLDIETTGISSYDHEITVIGLYNGLQTHHFISGENLEEFEEAVEGYDLLITFNGSRFDLPFITSFFPNLRFRQAHIDLLPLFGIFRDSEIQEMSGYEAVVLWHEHLRGIPDALPRLLKYNEADVVNLKTIMEIAWERLQQELEFAAGCLLPFNLVNGER
jgi:uncharacterized protein YprB with RNaseH-like and TPR domain